MGSVLLGVIGSFVSNRRVGYPRATLPHRVLSPPLVRPNTGSILLRGFLSTAEGGVSEEWQIYPFLSVNTEKRPILEHHEAGFRDIDVVTTVYYEGGSGALYSACLKLL